MIEAYFDESGIHENAPICVIAGYWALNSQWKWFEKKWRTTLEKYGFPLEHFHATDLVKGRRHLPMLEELTQTIARYPIYPTTVGIVVADFWSFTLKQRQFMTGATLDGTPAKFRSSGSPTRPYFVPFGLCLKMVTDRTKAGHRANFFFGLDKPMARYARTMFSEVKAADYLPDTAWWSKGRLGEPRFPLAKETPQLQAADLLVHLSYRHMKQRLEINEWGDPPDRLLAMCLRNSKSTHDHVYMDKACLQAGLEQSYSVFGSKWDLEG